MRILQIAWTISIASVFGADCAVIEKNGYKDIAIGFSGNVKKIEINFEKLKAILKNASEVLFQATRRRSYFEEFLFVVPPNWADSSLCEDFKTDGPQKIDIYISDLPKSPHLSATNSKGCGREGDIMRMSVDWLKGNTEDLAHQFIQQWSTYRYGVFAENPESTGSCTTSNDNTWSPTGCYDVKIDVEPTFGEDGQPSCYFPERFSEENDVHSSLMFQANSTKAVDFCDGSSRFPHNPVNPTLHNRICNGQTVWSVIKNGEDFRYGRNLQMKDKPPNKPVFRCFNFTKTQVTLAVQNSSAKVLSTEMTEIRYALLHFLSTMGSADCSVNLLTYADAAYEEDRALDLLSRDSLLDLLDRRLKQIGQVQNICIVCGFQKAYEVAMVDKDKYSSQVVVLFLWESSLKTTKPSDLIELIQGNPKVVPFLLLVKDTSSDIMPLALEDAVESAGGQIFRLRTNIIFMVTELNIALLEAFEKNLQIENKALIVYEKVHENVTSDILDVFSTPNIARGKLLYTMHCESLGLIRNVNSTCRRWDEESQTYKCGNEVYLDNSKDPLIVWKHYFTRYDYIRPVNCISLAWLKVESQSTSYFTLRGWLSRRKITPGQDSLIIYAEVIGINDWNVQAEARISGPGLQDFKLVLRDNGNGDPDIVKGDGIFSRYFTAFAEKGTYAVTITACYREMTNAANTIEKSCEDETRLSLVNAIGTFQLTQPAPEEDILPPNRVVDLKVVSIDHHNKTVQLQWTAPGNDYDYDRANQYVFKYSQVWMTLRDFTFNAEENRLLIPLDRFSPGNSGVSERAKFQCPQNSQNATYYIAFTSEDANRNIGKISNIVQVHFSESSSDETASSSDIDNYTKTTPSKITNIFSDTTEDIKNTFTHPPTSTEVEEKVTTVENDGKEKTKGLFIERNIAIIAFSTAGVIFLILIITIIIICCCWCISKKKYSEQTLPTKKLPYNLKIAYKNGSQSSLEAENEVGYSMSTLVDPSSSYSETQNQSQTEHRYSYHTEQSLLNNQKNDDPKNELGFKPVSSMPAYATSSLSRFVTRHSHLESSNLEPRISNLQESHHKDDTHIYSLGVV